MGVSTDTVINAVYSLEEPWLTRFLQLMAALANGSQPAGQRPTRREVADWLAANPALCREVRQLLHAWQGPER